MKISIFNFLIGDGEEIVQLVVVGDISLVNYGNSNERNNIADYEIIHVQNEGSLTRLEQSYVHSTPDMTAPISTSSVISESSNLLNQFASVDQISPVTVFLDSNIAYDPYITQFEADDSSMSLKHIENKTKTNDKQQDENVIKAESIEKQVEATSTVENNVFVSIISTPLNHHHS